LQQKPPQLLCSYPIPYRRGLRIPYLFRIKSYSGRPMLYLFRRETTGRGAQFFWARSILSISDQSIPKTRGSSGWAFSSSHFITGLVFSSVLQCAVVQFPMLRLSCKTSQGVLPSFRCTISLPVALAISSLKR